MSPVAPSSGHASRALVLSLVAVVVGMAAVWGASVLITSRHNQRATQKPVGGVVDLGPAVKLAGRISRDGGVPVYYPDVSGNNARSVYVTHRGTDPTTGWSAFLAQVPGEASSCLWTWNRSAGHFEATCDTSRHADRHGSGLVHYPATVRDGHLKVDLKVTPTTTSSSTAAPPSRPGSTAPATTVAP